MTRLAIPAAIAAVMLGIHLSIKRRRPEPDTYPDLIPMTWSLPDGYAATYRYILGPTGVPSSLN